MKDLNFLNEDFKDDLGLHQFAPLTTDALDINKNTGETNGKIEAIRTPDVSTIKNFFVKSGTVVALKRQYVISQGHAIVDIDMVYPHPETKWRNVYNQTWQGWKLMSGRVYLWSGKATEGDSITIGYPRSYFGTIEILFSNDERIICPILSDNTHVWGTLITTAGTEFYIKSIHLQFTDDNTIKIISCKERIASSGVISTKNIIKIVGRA